jgi:protein tyrosine/serine phosphatase
MNKQLMFLSLCLAGFITYAEDVAPTNRPATWAKPIQQAGLPNLHQITTNLYRSAQPTAEGMQNLKKLGVKTVINLRSFNSDRAEIGLSGLAYEHIYMKAWHPEEKEAIRFLQIVTDEKRLPLLFHCQHGADRTGIMCALYRVAVQGWTKAEALRELKKGGYGYHEVWVNLPPWFEKLDIEDLKKKAGITPPAAPIPTPEAKVSQP